MLSKKPASKKKASPKSTPKKRGVRPASAPDLSWHPRFLEILGSTCNVTLAARGAGIDKTTAYDHYRSQPDFAAQWDEAKESALEILEAEAWNRARIGGGGNCGAGGLAAPWRLDLARAAFGARPGDRTSRARCRDRAGAAHSAGFCVRSAGDPGRYVAA